VPATRTASSSGAPKSRASRRTVSIPGPIRQLLVTYLGAGLGGTGQSDELIFTTANRHPVRHGRFYGKVFRPAVKRTWPEGHRLHRLRWHDLRHTCAALSLAVSPNLHVVKERLGHESITTTIDIYGHLLPSVDAALMDGLGELFDNAQKNAPDNVVDLQSPGVS
jgi:integrase